MLYMDINFHVDFSNDATAALFLDVIHACNLRQTVTDHKKTWPSSGACDW